MFVRGVLFFLLMIMVFVSKEVILSKITIENEWVSFFLMFVLAVIWGCILGLISRFIRKKQSSKKN